MWLPRWTAGNFAERFAELLPKQLLKQHDPLTSLDVLEPEMSTKCLSTTATFTQVAFEGPASSLRLEASNLHGKMLGKFDRGFGGISQVSTRLV